MTGIAAKIKFDKTAGHSKFDSATNMFCFYGACKSGFRAGTVTVPLRYTTSTVTKSFFARKYLFLSALIVHWRRNFTVQKSIWINNGRLAVRHGGTGCNFKFDSATNMFCFLGECKSGFREYTITV